MQKCKKNPAKNDEINPFRSVLRLNNFRLKRTPNDFHLARNCCQFATFDELLPLGVQSSVDGTKPTGPELGSTASLGPCRRSNTHATTRRPTAVVEPTAAATMTTLTVDAGRSVHRAEPGGLRRDPEQGVQLGGRTGWQRWWGKVHADGAVDNKMKSKKVSVTK